MNTLSVNLNVMMVGLFLFYNPRTRMVQNKIFNLNISGKCRACMT